MNAPLLEIHLFGHCMMKTIAPFPIDIKGSKHKALIVLLATAPDGRRSRIFLQERLWGVACFDSGRQSLRRAMSDIKKILGPVFGELISSNNADIEIDQTRIRYAGNRLQGIFLEGLEVKEPKFLDWVRSIRTRPEQLDALCPPVDTRFNASPPCIAILPFRVLEQEAGLTTLAQWLGEEVARLLSRTGVFEVRAPSLGFGHQEIERTGRHRKRLPDHSRMIAANDIDRDQIQQTKANPLSRVEPWPPINPLDRALHRPTSELGDEECARESVPPPDYYVLGTIRPSGGTLILDADILEAETAKLIWTRQIQTTKRKCIADPIRELAPVLNDIQSTIAALESRSLTQHAVHDETMTRQKRSRMGPNY